MYMWLFEYHKDAQPCSMLHVVHVMSPMYVVKAHVCQKCGHVCTEGTCLLSSCLPAGCILDMCYVHCCGRTGYHASCDGFCSTQKIAFHSKGTPCALRVNHIKFCHNLTKRSGPVTVHETFKLGAFTFVHGSTCQSARQLAQSVLAGHFMGESFCTYETED